MTEKEMQDKYKSKTQHEFQVTLENYVKAIWNLTQVSKELRNVDLARYLGVTRASVTGMLNKLEAQRYVLRSESGIQLSAKGKTVALLILRKHRIVEMFLSRTLKLSGIELHEEAELLEHAISPLLLEKMDAYLGYPKVDDSGVSIPQKGEKSHLDFSKDSKALLDVQEGTVVKVVSIADYDPQFMQKLTDKGFDRGCTLSVLDTQKNAYIHLELDGGRQVVLSHEEASLLRVSEAY